MSKVFSGFTADRYLQIGKYIPTFSTIKIIVKANSSSYSSHNVLMCGNNWFGVRNNSYPSIYISGWTQGSTTIQTNKDYWFCLDYSDGTNFNYYTLEDNNYTLSTLPALENWVYQCKTTTNFLNGDLFRIGSNKNSSGENWKGNVSEFQIIVDGTEWFNLQNSKMKGYQTTGSCFVSVDEGWVNFAATNSRYLRTTNNFSPSTNSWEIDLSFCTGNNIFTENTIVSGNSNNLFSLGVKTDKLYHTISSNGSSWTYSSLGLTTLLPNTKYYVKIIYDASNSIYEVKLSTDGINYSSDYSQECTLYTSFNNFIKFGLGRAGSEPFQGSISIKSCNIYIDNTLWFDGSTAVENTDYTLVGNVIYISKPKLATNFSSSNFVRLNPIANNNNDSMHTGIVRIYYTQINSYLQDILANSLRDFCWAMYPANDSTRANKIDFYNGTAHMSVTDFITNNWYYIGYTWDGKTYKFYSMLDTGKYTSYLQLPFFDNNDWTLEASFNDTTNLYADGIILGYNVAPRDSNRYWRGLIDLENSVIGNNVINYKIGKTGYINQFDHLTINENTTESVTLTPGITFTINPTPADATVTLWADGYQQTDRTNTITTVEGTTVNYTVTKKGYVTQNGTYSLTSSNYTMSITLEESSYVNPFIQPELTANGTMGGDSFACNQNAYYSSTTLAWRCFKAWDGSSIGESDRWQINSVSTSTYYYIEWYNPSAILVNKLTIYNAESSYTVRDYILQGSNDYSTWANIISGTNTNTAGKGMWEINVPDNMDAYKYFRLQCKPNTGTSLQICKIYISGYTA